MTPIPRHLPAAITAAALFTVAVICALGCASGSSAETGDVPAARDTGTMRTYADVDGDSGVAAYEAGADYIRVRFEDGSVYVYTDESAGASNIEQMKELAAAGDGLNAFINTNVKHSYASKSR